MRNGRDVYSEGQYQWQLEEASNYTHPIDVQLFADRPLLSQLGNVTGQFVLDIGCGNGYLLRKVRTRGAHVIGIDTSEEMVNAAQSLEPAGTHARLCVASADALPFVSSTFNAVFCSLTINNLSSTDMLKNTFREAARVLKLNSAFVISLPHPHTLDAITRFRWTEWEDGQTQENLIPGEGFKRQIMGLDGSMISIVNYYWPKEVLTKVALRAGFRLEATIEETASLEEITHYRDELDPIFSEVPFFLVMRFTKENTAESC